MNSTTFSREMFTCSHGGHPVEHPPNELNDRYQALISDNRFAWTEHHTFTRLLGSGGQGVVYLSERRGADGFTLPVAVKIFSPERYHDPQSYDQAMQRIATIAARVALIQHDNLLDVNNFVDRARIRLMEMEWVDGYDLRRLLTNEMLDRARLRVRPARFEYINNVIVTAGASQPRVKPGIAIAILRECLAALGALQRDGIVHGDIKPSNIMLKRTGNAKLIDIGSAFDLDNIPQRRPCTPAYAAPEILEGALCSPRADLCSLGYVLVEMLAGLNPFAGLVETGELLEAKRTLVQRLPHLLPKEVVCNELLMTLCRGLVSPDPTRRYPNAEAADMLKEGAAGFQRQLVKGDLASEYENEIRMWLAELDE